MTRIGLLHPGAMGASVGAAASGNGHTVLWASQGRSAATRERARRGALQDVAVVPDVLASCEILLSVCPPHAAEEVAAEVAKRGFSGLYVDCNAVSPERTRGIQRTVEKGGADYVDGGIIGGPAWTHEAGTRLYLSGPRAGMVAACFADSPLSAPVISERIGAASALKMGYAAFTKGSTALLTAILGMVEKEGVRTDLARQWGDAFTDQTVRRVCDNTAKAWRFEGEMHEIAATFDAAGLPGGFHQAAAEVFRRLAGFKAYGSPPDIETVLDVLLKREQMAYGKGTDRMSDQATLQGIAVRGASRAPMREVQEANVTVTHGIVEDYRGTGLRQVTFIGAGQWRQVMEELGADLPWHTRRANLLVDGLDLTATVGSRLRIGDCLFEIHGETEPCERMNELQTGLRAGLVPEMRGGVWGRVIESGQLRVGQSVEVAE